ncbi:MAG: preprotein translocase subunit SecG [Candidatus Algichlamydia australiensis]|nr:preprotein translocase subunit SecG [Chlamydiales bacterium]
MTILFFIGIALFLLLAFVLCAVILIQESKSMGLGAAFGGDSGNALFGTDTADVLKKFTATLVTIFMISCIVLSLWSSAMGRKAPAPIPTTIEQVQE